MNNLFENGFENLKKYYKIKKNNFDFIVDNTLSIDEGETTIIHCSSVNEGFYALGQYLAGNKNLIKRPIKEFGMMIDNARNAVYNLDAYKRLIMSSALLGYTYIGLYMEDCFEVDDEPLFGYMRGRFTQDEIKELVEFSDMYGIEIRPYIQTLAHLNRIFNHRDPYLNEVHDMHDCLLMDEPRTYVLIENYIKSVAKCFKSRHLHLGLDESWVMTQGKYQELHQDFDKAEVFFRHVDKVIGIAKKYDFEVEAWGDMFLKHGKKELMNDNLTITYWNYHNQTVEANNEAIAQYKTLTDNVSFATGIHKWVGFAPLNEYALRCVIPAIKACIANNIQNLCITMWGDDGAECSFTNCYAAIINASTVMFNANDYLNKLCLLLTNYNYKELLALDKVNKVFDKEFDRLVNPSKYLLFEDIFYGLDDLPDNAVYTKYFKKAKDELCKLRFRKSYLKQNFVAMYYLADTLYKKNNIRQDLLTAYSMKDKGCLCDLALKNITKTIRALKKFKNAYIKLWHKDAKPNGLEIILVRLSGLIARLKYIRKRVLRYYLNIDKSIPELEEKSLQVEPNNDDYNGATLDNNYARISSPATITFNTYI